MCEPVAPAPPVVPTATVVDSVVGRGASIGRRRTVVGSVVLPGARIGGDAVVEALDRDGRGRVRADGSFAPWSAPTARLPAVEQYVDARVPPPTEAADGRRRRPVDVRPTDRAGGVLVIGGAGFIGSHLVDRLLADGDAVDVVDDLSTGSLANLADARARRRDSTPASCTSTPSTRAAPTWRR